LEISWRSLAILVFVSGGLGALITAGRERTMRQFRKRIACVSTSADHPHSVEELRDIGLEARERTHRSAWQMGGLDGARTRDLEQLVARGIETSRQRLKRSLLAELRHLREADPEHALGAKGFRSLEAAVWLYVEEGELDSTQHGFLLEAIRDGRRQAERSRSAELE
jgi:hypothetical protein